MTTNFSVLKRNYGHWDINGIHGRLYRIRGGPGRFLVMDEIKAGYPVTEFKTLTACMAFICDELMHEEITAGSCGNNNPIV